MVAGRGTNTLRTVNNQQYKQKGGLYILACREAPSKHNRTNKRLTTHREVCTWCLHEDRNYSSSNGESAQSNKRGAQVKRNGGRGVDTLQLHLTPQLPAKNVAHDSTPSSTIKLS